MTRDDLIAVLRQAGHLRREAAPEDELVWALAPQWAAAHRCNQCGSAGMRFDQGDEAADWGDARMCETCRAPISTERLEVFPNATCCASCQSKQERSPQAEEREFCQHCGGLITIVLAGGSGVSKYRSKCQDCGR